MIAINTINCLRHLEKLYLKMSKPICSKYAITKIEMDIIAFVANNKELNTAKEIVEYRSLTKSHVSLSLESLEQSGHIKRLCDAVDKRIDRISLNPICEPIIKDVRDMQKEFSKALTDGIKPSQIKLMTSTIEKIAANAKDHLSD